MSITSPSVARHPYIHRMHRRKGDGWTVIVGSGPKRHQRSFRDSEHGGTETALQAAIAYRDGMLALPHDERQHSTEQKSSQLRIRLLPDELASFERKREQDWAEGKVYAENLSSWVRHQVQPLLNPNSSKQLCMISRELYQKAEKLARLLDRPTETVIEECVNGIENLIHHTKVETPLIVAEWRLRQLYLESKKKT